MKKLITVLLFFSFCFPVNADWVKPVPDKFADCFGYFPGFPNTLAMGKQGTSYSTDYGNSWLTSSSGMPLYPDNIVNRLFSSPNYFYAGLNSGIYNEYSLPGYWENLNYNLPSNTNVKAITYLSPYIFIATTRGIFKKHENFTAWFYSGLVDTLCVEIMAKDGILFEGSQLGGVNVSLDTGRTWIKRNTGIAAADYWVFSYTYNNNYIFAGTSSERVYRTSNNGVSWENVSNGLPQNAFDAIYSIKAISNNVLIAGTGTGIFASSNNGINWSNFNQGIEAGAQMRSDGLFKFGSYLFAGMTSGIYRRPLSDIVSVKNNNTLLADFNLEQNYPNPFNPNTVISYSLSVPDVVSLKVYDMKGNEIAELVNGRKEAGNYSVSFDAGKYNLSSGIYFYRLKTENSSDTKRMILVK